MKSLRISYTGSNTYFVEGAIKDLLANKRARMMLRTYLPYEENNNSLKFESEEGIDHIASILKFVAGYINATVEYDDKTSAAIADFKKQEEDFIRFSKEANDIKNNRFNKADLQEFADVLTQKMTSRTLYPLQLLSAYHLAFSQNGCNFSVPGAGKTSIVYGAYTYLKNCSDTNKTVDKLLIIGPLSSFGPWENEYKDCFGVKVNSQRINGLLSVDEKRQYFYGKTAELTLLSYQSVINLKEELEYFLRNNQVMVVLDEAHKIKSTNGGIIANVVMGLSKMCRSRVILTGTPAPNGYEDLFNLFRFIWPNHDVIRYNVAQLRDMTRAAEDYRVPRLMENLSPFFIRIKKSDLKLPPATENPPLIVPMGDAQRRIYDFIEERFVDEVSRNSNDSPLHRFLVKAKMIRLLQAATNPALLREPLNTFSEELEDDPSSYEVDDEAILNDIMLFYDEQIPAKFQICLNLVKSIIGRGEKVIIWASFIKNIEQLSSYLLQEGIPSRTLYGSTPVANEGMSEEDLANTREGIVNEFNSSTSSFKVIIANPFAVAESISLHKACHNAIYLERSFNCAHYLQSKDRIHRYGLPDDTKTNYYYIISERSVDETVNSRLQEKERRMLEIIEGLPIPLFLNATDEGDADIKAIINDYVRRKTGTAQ